MLVYGVAILAGCYLIGQIIGQLLGRVLNIDANVGGVGFAMLFLILVNQWMHRKKWFTKEMESGIEFWNKMYIPVIVAMSSIQNVKGAISSGMVAVLAGIIPTAICFFMIPYISKLSKSKMKD
ncbi:MAG: malonate transporter subunit MadL [Bacteroidia bacterium]|nr:malonate transporter subunit MadL [Bacteroidia bacterium]